MDFLKRTAKIRGLYNSYQIFGGFLLTKISKSMDEVVNNLSPQKAGAKIGNILTVSKLICTISEKKCKSYLHFLFCYIRFSKSGRKDTGLLRFIPNHWKK
jgi:hypothetical protein